MRNLRIMLVCFLALEAWNAAPAQSSLQTAPSPNPPVYQVGKDGVTPPKLVHSVNPKYTKEARKLKLRGIVGLSIVVDEQGVPQRIKVIHSLAEVVDPKYHDAAIGMDEVAMETVNEYRFQAAMLKGKPVAVSINVEMNFQAF